MKFQIVLIKHWKYPLKQISYTFSESITQKFYSPLQPVFTNSELNQSDDFNKW
jgi:hypothetical protein